MKKRFAHIAVNITSISPENRSSGGTIFPLCSDLSFFSSNSSVTAAAAAQLPFSATIPTSIPASITRNFQESGGRANFGEGLKAAMGGTEIGKLEGGLPAAAFFSICAKPSRIKFMRRFGTATNRSCVLNH